MAQDVVQLICRDLTIAVAVEELESIGQSVLLLSLLLSLDYHLYELLEVNLAVAIEVSLLYHGLHLFFTRVLAKATEHDGKFGK
jgi:hypothetical protein